MGRCAVSIDIDCHLRWYWSLLVEPRLGYNFLLHPGTITYSPDFYASKIDICGLSQRDLERNLEILKVKIIDRN